ncbi:N-6 DNA methylase [Candidatus Pacearchaeota archaeon]|nr:N-6 DNA methylase [Candidatus Pacearchaeota archaeon]
MVTKEEAKERVKQLVQEFKEIPKSHLDSMSEEDIKRLFITPLLELLGWKKFDIQSEFRILKGRADYLLKTGNTEVLVVEAKKTSVSLTEDEGRQAVSYAYHSKIKFAVLTNFRYLRVFHALSNIKNIDNNLLKINNNYFRLDFEEYIDKFEILWLLSKESFEKGEINKLLSAKDERINKPIDKKLLDDFLKIREILSKEIKSKKNYLKKEKIDECVQILIDRLIFIRSVEDRGLEPTNFLLGLDGDVRSQRVRYQLFPYLLEKFKDFNQKYDSRLFEEGLLEKEGAFSDEDLHKVIRILYFGAEDNQTKYMFNEIPGDIFGDIYEQYLGTILSGTEKRIKLDSKSGKRKSMGIYYTPSYIVDYIVKNTVGEYIKNKSIDEILEVKILDPACGSGSFLTRAFQEICDIIKDKLNEWEEGSKILFKKPKEKLIELNFGQKIEILRNCIYGVDLDEKAVELARLNLMLKTLEGVGPEIKKPTLPHLTNIKCGNSLIDDYSVAGDKAFNWQAQFPEVFRNGGFDIVIGNPPWGAKIESRIFDKKYPNFNLNSFSLFVYKGLEMISKESLLGYIIPKNFIRTNDYATAREKIVKNYQLIQVIDTGKFPGVVQEAVILIIKNKKEINEKILTGIISENGKNIQGFMDQSSIIKNQDFVFDISSNNLIRELKIKIEKNGSPLKELIVLSRGIETGKSGKISICQKCGNWLATPRNSETKFCPRCKFEVKISEKNTENMISEKKDKNYTIPILAGNQIERYYVKRNYFLMPNIKGINYKNSDFFKKNKIVLVRILPKIVATLDDEGRFTLKTLYNLNLSSKSPISLKHILGIMNSKLFSFYYEYSYNLGGNLTPSLTQANIKKFPIVTKKSEILDKNIDQMLLLQKKFHEEKSSGGEKERLEQQIKNIDHEIDQEIYKLYEITEDEKKIIEESLR